MLHVFTYSTSPEKMQFLKASAELHGVPLQNLSKTNEWNGLQDKVKAIKTALSVLPETDIVCFLDAYDVIINADIETILETFKQANTDLFVGAEINLSPGNIYHLKEVYPESPTEFRYLNSGCYIGYVHAVKALWETVKDENDQADANEYYIQNQSKIKLDTATNLVLNMESVPWDTIQICEGVIQYIPLQTDPCFVHFNGMSYLDMEKECIHLGENKYTFDYKKVYTRVFSAILSSKLHSYKVDVVCKLTGHGTTY